MSCEFLNEVVDEYLTFHQTRMLPERKIPIPKRNSNMSEQMLLGNGNISQELGSYQTTSSAFSVIWKSKYCTVYQCIDIMMHEVHTINPQDYVPFNHSLHHHMWLCQI